MPPKKASTRTSVRKAPLKEVATVSPAHHVGKTNAAKHAFLYLTSFFTLGCTAVSIGVLFFQLINFYFPEEIRTYTTLFSEDAVKFSLSLLIIAAPVFFFITRNINRNIAKKDLDMDSGVRRWLTYIVMFITVGIVIGDLVSVVYSFLDGELTVRFILKALTLLIISGGIFLYYLMDMRNKDLSYRMRRNNMWSLVFWILVLVPLFWSFVIMENPQEARLRKIDDATEQAVQNIKYAVEDFTGRSGRLPNDLNEISNSAYYYPDTPEAKKVTYSVSNAPQGEYRLCAEFNQSTDERSRSYYYNPELKHPAGMHCFSLMVTKSLLIPSTNGNTNLNAQ